MATYNLFQPQQQMEYELEEGGFMLWLERRNLQAFSEILLGEEIDLIAIPLCSVEELVALGVRYSAAVFMRSEAEHSLRVEAAATLPTCGG